MFFFVLHIVTLASFVAEFCYIIYVELFNLMPLVLQPNANPYMRVIFVVRSGYLCYHFTCKFVVVNASRVVFTDGERDPLL